MKKLILLVALFTISLNYAQNLRKYIPNDAVFVGSINGKNILESITIEELDRSKLGQDILKEVRKSATDSIVSFSDFNINTNGESVFFYVTNDSISYFTLILPLKSASFFDNGFDKVTITDKGSFKYKTLNTNGSELVAWDNEKVVFTVGEYSYSYFNDYDFSSIEEELKAQASTPDENAEEVIELAPPSPDVTETKEQKETHFDKEFGYGDVPYFKNYRLENYAFEYHYLSQDLKKALKENNTSDLTTVLKLNIDNINNYVNRVDSIQESDAEKLDDFIANKEFFLKRRADSISTKKDRETALQIIEDATHYSTKFKTYPNVAESNYNLNSYNDHYKEKIELQKRWTLGWVENVMIPAQKSILLNKGYMGQLDSAAEFNVWSENYMESYMNTLGSLYNTFGLHSSNLKNTFSEYGTLSGNLYLNNDEAQFNLDVTLKGNLLEISKNVAKHKLNPKFFHYMNEDKFIGYLSYNMSMESALKEYPKLMSSVYGSLLYDKTDEINLVSELVSILIDEEAIAELIDGDAIFILSDITEKEVTYTDYEYDENYNSTEVQKTKMETVPDFMFMFTSKEEKFKNLLIRYLLKKQLIQQTGTYYKIIDDKGELPIGVFFTIKDDIVFLTTSESDIRSISTNTYASKISSQLKKDIKKSQYAAYFNGKKFSSEVQLQSFTDKIAKKLLDNATNFKLKSGFGKNDTIRTEVIMEVPEGKVNAIKYVLDIFDSFMN